jgi:nondiscriminating glutamyl-tRNA synthetase
LSREDEVLMLAEIRVRFAPSPTGYLHIGGARTALFNYLFARKNKGKFILRIEDTDTERTIEDSAERLMEAFKWMGLEWDEGPIVGGPVGPYFQSQRQDLYREYAKVLLDKGFAYRCYCTPQELEADRAKARAEKRAPRYSGRCRELTKAQIAQFEAEGRRPALRFRVPDTETTVVQDLVHGEVTFRNQEIADFIVVKSDGFPTYNYACVVDDWLMGLSHVIRADEHLSNTPKQMMLYSALSAPMPKFAHVPMILAPDRAKLSKRHGAQTVEEFRDKGYFPEALVNYIALLGWTPSDSTKEIMSLDEMIEEFDLGRVSSTPAVYDTTKLTWMNGQYIRNLDKDSLVEKYISVVSGAGLASRKDLQGRREWLGKIAMAIRERVKTTDEMVDMSRYFFEAPSKYDEVGVRRFFANSGVATLLRKGAQVLDAVDDWNLDSLERAYRDLIEREGIKSGEIIHPTRLALTGRTVGPGLFEIVEILGKSEVCDRLAKAAGLIEANAFAEMGKPRL